MLHVGAKHLLPCALQRRSLCALQTGYCSEAGRTMGPTCSPTVTPQTRFSGSWRLFVLHPVFVSPHCTSHTARHGPPTRNPGVRLYFLYLNAAHRTVGSLRGEGLVPGTLSRRLWTRPCGLRAISLYLCTPVNKSVFLSLVHRSSLVCGVGRRVPDPSYDQRSAVLVASNCLNMSQELVVEVDRHCDNQ